MASNPGVVPFPQGTSSLTQAQRVVGPPTPQVIYRTSFAGEVVKRLNSADFRLDSKELVALAYDDCILVLFYTENTESQQLVKVWAVAAQQVAGPVFAALNVLDNRGVAEAFTRLKMDGSHPLHWASLRGYPFVLVYRRGWPVAFYNGAREVQAVIDYALTLACEAGYYEPLQEAASMQAEARLEMGPYDVYLNEPGQPPVLRTNSTQYTSDEPVRGFNPNLRLVATGSTAAQEELQAIRAEQAGKAAEERRGLTGTLTEARVVPPEAGPEGAPPAPGEEEEGLPTVAAPRA